MTYKLFIIDDNHSLVDSLKVMLKDLPLQYESAFRFQEAHAKLDEKGCFFNREEKARLDKLISQVADLSGKKQDKDAEQNSTVEERIEIKIEDLIDDDIHSPFQEEGFFLVLVEHDTENNTKGLDFIQNMIRGGKGCWNENDFLLMTSRYTLVHEKAESLNIQVIEKPIQNNQLKQIIQQKIKTTQENKIKVDSILKQLSLQSFPIRVPRFDEPEKPKRKRVAKAVPKK